VERQRAFEADKLIPVKIGEFTMPLNIEGITIGRQMILVPDFDAFLTGGGFQCVCHVLGKGEAPATVKNVPVSAIPGKGSVFTLRASSPKFW
jgi:hypothetical protein